jgi:hypothetical protein
LDPTLVSRANDAIARALEGGRALTEAGIDWRNDRGLLAHLAPAAELEAVICRGPLKGSQHT